MKTKKLVAILALLSLGVGAAHAQTILQEAAIRTPNETVRGQTAQEDKEKKKVWNPYTSHKSYSRCLDYNFPKKVLNALKADKAKVQSIHDGSGPYYYDNFEIVVKMPRGESSGKAAKKFLLEMLKDMNGTIDNEYFSEQSTFSRRVTTRKPKVGDIIDLDILGPDNASIMLTALEDQYFRFTTITTPEKGAHPINGQREFGYQLNNDGSVTFYTRAADRAYSFIESDIVNAPRWQRNLWTGWLRGIEKTIQKRGGKFIRINPIWQISVPQPPPRRGK